MAEERGVGETEAEIGVELSAEGSGLGVEDSGVGAAAVEAEEAGEGQSGVGLVFDCHDRYWERAL